MHPVIRILIFILPGLLSAAPVSESTARSIATSLLHRVYARQAAGSGLACRPVSGSDGTVCYRIFADTLNGGWAVVSGDDRFRPVLGYCREGGGDVPPPVQAWLDGYRNEILSALHAGLEEKGYRPKTAASAADSAGPLIQSSWGQGWLFNGSCPYDSTEATRTKAGCTATAMAQVMRYWSYPPAGAGFHSYFHDRYGTLSADFSATQYDWAAMPYTMYLPNTEVSRLMYHCGVSVDMAYGPDASSAYLLAVGSPTENCAEFALREYFGYLPQVQGVQREAYADSAWESMLRTEIDSGQPVIYAGFSEDGGHAFICDGYAGNGFFHINWGWDGDWDGWFALSALEPNSQQSFNERHQAVVGIRPPAGFADYELGLYQSVTAPLTMVGYGDAFKVETDVSNRGTAAFTGDFCAALFDMDGVFKAYSRIRTGISLGPDEHFITGIDFTFENSWQTLPGRYKAFTYYRPSGSEAGWQRLFTDKQRSVRESVIVAVAESAAIELYEPMDVKNGTPAVSGQPFSVWLDAANYTDSAFAGEFFVGLFDADNGDFACLVELKTDMTLSAMSHYVPGLTFSTDSLAAKPGSYLVALKFRHGSDGPWLLAGSRIEPNPIALTVLGPPLAADAWEANDSAVTAYAVSPSFTGDSAIEVIDANFHRGTDRDYYRIVFAGGYRYHMAIGLADAATGDTAVVWSADAQVTYSGDGAAWSVPYDGDVPDSVQIEGPDTLLVHVSPVFQGITGTYRLTLGMRRVVISGVMLSVGMDRSSGQTGVVYDLRGRRIGEGGAIPAGVYVRKIGEEIKAVVRVDGISEHSNIRTSEQSNVRQNQ